MQLNLRKATRLLYTRCSARARMDPINFLLCHSSVIRGGIGSPGFSLSNSVINTNNCMTPQHFTLIVLLLHQLVLCRSECSVSSEQLCCYPKVAVVTYSTINFCNFFGKYISHAFSLMVQLYTCRHCSNSHTIVLLVYVHSLQTHVHIIRWKMFTKMYFTITQLFSFFRVTSHLLQKEQHTQVNFYKALLQ